MSIELSVIIPFCNEVPQVVFTIQSVIEELEGFCEYEILAIDNMSSWYLNCQTDTNVLLKKTTVGENSRSFPVRQRSYFKAPPGSKRDGNTINTHFFKTKQCRYIIYDDKLGHWNAKNKGIEESQGKFLLFLDAHCVMKRDSLRNMVEFLRNPPEEKIGGVHAYIAYILDSHNLEYDPVKGKMYGYRFCSQQREEYWLEDGRELDVSDTVRYVQRAAANPPSPKIVDDDGKPQTWQSKYGSNPIVSPYLTEGGVSTDPSWPKRLLRHPTKPYKVCVMSTCGMMCPRQVLDELGGWHPEFGIYCGGEAYMNYKQSTCGYHHWIHPAAVCWHWAEKRGYSWNHSDFVRNEQIAAYVCGGRAALDFCVKARKSTPAVMALADDVVAKCHKEREFIKSKQVETLDEYVDRWIANPGVWK
jgi:glycosyltransferase involved in cell wall biosynthesis